MPGRFGGDYEEELEELDEESAIDEETEETEEEQIEESAKDKVMQHRFKEIKRNTLKRFYPYPKPSEKPVLRYMKKHHYGEYKSFEKMLKSRKEAFWHRVKLIAPPVLVFVLIFGFIMVALSSAGGELKSRTSWITGDGSASSAYGIMGDKFYGARLVFKDEEKARVEILNNFAIVIGDVEKAIETADSRVDITINLPTAEFDYSKFDETSFQTDYSNTYQIMVEMAGLIAEYDRVEGETAEYPTLTEKVDAIKYFGYNLELATTGENNLAKIVASAINDNDLYVIDNSSAEAPAASDVEALVANKATEVLSHAKYGTRTEKLFVKDYILEANKRMENIPKENYVAMIFLPKTEVEFNRFSFAVSHEDYDNFGITLKNGANELSLNREVFTTVEGDGALSYLYYTADNLGINASKSNIIDENNLNALATNKSLLQILTDESLNRDFYLTTNGNEVLTYKTEGINVEFDSNQVFLFAEFETKYN